MDAGVDPDNTIPSSPPLNLAQDLRGSLRPGTPATPDQVDLLRHLASAGALHGSLGHDIRNTINAIGLATYFLQTKLTGMEPVVLRQIERINDSCKKATRLLKEFEDYAAMQAPVLTPQPLIPVIQQAVVQSGAQEAQIEIEVDEPLPLVVLDARYLVLAVRKLLERTLQKPTDLPIRILLHAVEGGVEIIIEDRGSSIDVRQRLSLFQPLVGGPADAKKDLGLALVTEIVGAHGGLARCEAFDEDGNQIIIRLPAG